MRLALRLLRPPSLGGLAGGSALAPSTGDLRLDLHVRLPTRVGVESRTTWQLIDLEDGELVDTGVMVGGPVSEAETPEDAVEAAQDSVTLTDAREYGQAGRTIMLGRLFWYDRGAERFEPDSVWDLESGKQVE